MLRSLLQSIAFNVHYDSIVKFNIVIVIQYSS